MKNDHFLVLYRAASASENEYTILSVYADGPAEDIVEKIFDRGHILKEDIVYKIVHVKNETAYMVHKTKY